MPFTTYLTACGPKDEQKKELQKELDARRGLVRGGVADWVQGAKFKMETDKHSRKSEFRHQITLACHWLKSSFVRDDCYE